MDKVKIDTNLAQKLIAEQFPQWQSLPIHPVAQSGWDNRTFHLGEEMVIRLPSDLEYEPQINKEYKWLPWLSMIWVRMSGTKLRKNKSYSSIIYS
ncbi:hypothetical protein TUM19329_24400 [Legionella antarctica]|uniref:Aminoglycoside phosphotransferase n=1 Tax=Legionella antarctica TaxID=2708020 RepID=A0A6F8T6K0_9GAMM|nr:hypothetical protein [Legionella antarctica]BCA96079.1 hypothetical protein TUM19329_24400 [Legionella antarctica]